MSKQLQLSIPKPCHENWEAMTPVQQGKFCGSCRKQVVDFSNMSDRQMAEFFKKPSAGSVCGRFMTDQLDRSIEIPKKRIPWLKYFFQFAIPAFLFSIKASAEKTQGKIKVNSVTKDTTKMPFPEQMVTMGAPVARPICTKPQMGDTLVMPEVVVTAIEPSINRRLMGKVMSYTGIKVDTSVIKGKVLDEKSNLVPYATIMIKGTTMGTVTDANGLFSIKVPGNREMITLVASCVAYMPVEVMIDKKAYTDPITIELEPQTSVMVGELVVYRKPPTKKEIKNIPLIPVIADDKHTAVFNVFPNPVSSGANLNIEWKQTEEGYYLLQLLNQSGQIAHQQEIWIDAEARLLNINIPGVAAGNYFLAFINKKSGKRFAEKIIIQ